jgi:hypothetical protein
VSRSNGRDAWNYTFRVTADGRYQLNGQSVDGGRFQVDGERKRWQMYSTRGFVTEGSYERLDDRSVTVRGGQFGNALWRKR